METNRESWATTILVIVIMIYLVVGAIALPLVLNR